MQRDDLAAVLQLAIDGDSAAWEQIYLACGTRLVSAVRGRCHENECEDVVADAWVWLLSNAEVLRRFDPSRGTLVTFLAAVCRHRAGVYRRSYARRRKRERLASRRNAVRDATIIEDDLLATLTPAERTMYLHLTGRGAMPETTDSNRWQMASRLRRKIARYHVC